MYFTKTSRQNNFKYLICDQLSNNNSFALLLRSPSVFKNKNFDMKNSLS